jgi:hypothetical protein
LQKLCDIVDPVVDDDPAVRIMIVPRYLVQRYGGLVDACLLLLWNVRRRRFAEAQRRDGEAESVSSQRQESRLQ